MTSEGRRIAYDKFWGAMLLVAAAMPYRLDGQSYLWNLVLRPGLDLLVRVWLLAAPVAAVVALSVGLAGWRGRLRHFLNFAAGTICLALPLLTPAIWEVFPEAEPSRLPLRDVGAAGWLMLVALGALYAGSGMRIVRPAQVPGQVVGGLGAILLAVFAFLPMEGSDTSFALARLELLPEIGTRWRELLPFLLIAGAAVFGTINFLRSRREVALAKLTRLLLVAGMLGWLALPFLGEAQREGGDVARHVPQVWGTLHLLAPLLLAVDGAIAYVAVSITRSGE